MENTSLNAASVWAISATAVALVLAGVLIGQKLERPTLPQASLTEATEPGATPYVDPYVVPEWLAGAPLEWRSEVTDAAKGIAILLDYNRRELLVDQCSHAGFFDFSKNRPKENGSLRCERLLTSRITSFTVDGADVTTREGNEMFVTLKPVLESDVSKLDIGFDSLKMRLIPGQTNDLNQAIVQLPSVAKEKEALNQFKIQQEMQQRAQMASANQQGVPRFEVPAAVLEQHKTQREQDLQDQQALTNQRAPAD